jgi:hypothetical protein
MIKKAFLTLSFYLLFSYPCYASQISGEYTINHQGRQQKVLYDFFHPNTDPKIKLPILVCVGGLASKDGTYIHSLPNECKTNQWKQFAARNNLSILSLGFLFVWDDWQKQTSYQYPRIWSGQALLDIITIIKEDFQLKDELYLYGISAGSQFSLRFGQNWPQISKGVTAHAAGGYDWPTKFIPPNFLITVGELDNEGTTRREMAKKFTQMSESLGINIKLEIIPNVGHWQTKEQDMMSQEFITDIIKNQK